jgi:superfamily I DNA/RNA helicase
MNLLDQLNPLQRAVALHPPDGILLVEALAGSGKTRSLRARIQHVLRVRETDQSFGAATGSGRGNPLFAMLQQQQAEAGAGKILVLAYGKAIADEIGGFMDAELSADDRKRVLVKTSHGMATSMLYKYRGHTPLAPGVKIDLVPQWKLLQALADHRPVEDAGLKRVQLAGILSMEAIASARGIPAIEAYPRVHYQTRKLMDMDPEDAVQWIPILRAFRMKTGMLTHDDTIPLANAMPSSAFKALGFTDVIVDELQDLNFQQRQLVFNLMAGAKSFTGLGDSYQAIATFQGSDPRIFQHMRDQYASRGVTTLHLTNNYRCTEAILHVANQVLTRELGSEHQLVGNQKLGPAVEVHTNGTESLIGCLRQREASGEDWKHMAVLYRFHKHAPEVEMALATSGIPYVLTGASFFEQPEVQDMLSYFELLYRPKPEYAYWRRIIDHYQGLGSYTAQTAWDQLGGNPLLNFRKRVPTSLGKHGMRETWARFQNLAGLLQQAKTPAEAVKTLRQELGNYWGDRCADNPEKLVEKLDMADGFVDWVVKFGSHASGLDVLLAVDAYDQGNRKRDPDADAVQLSTCHASKGREFETVVLYNIGAGSFPAPANTDEDKLAEQRLMYVGLTRAKRFLALVAKSEADAASARVCTYVPNYQAMASAMLELDFDAVAHFPDTYKDAA